MHRSFLQRSPDCRLFLLTHVVKFDTLFCDGGKLDEWCSPSHHCTSAPHCIEASCAFIQDDDNKPLAMWVFINPGTLACCDYVDGTVHLNPISSTFTTIRLLCCKNLLNLTKCVWACMPNTTMQACTYACLHGGFGQGDLLCKVSIFSDSNSCTEMPEPEKEPQQSWSCDAECVCA